MAIVKNILLSVLMGASVAAAALMVLVGYSDRINPVAHPTLACAGMAFPFFLVANLLLLVLWVVVKWRKVWVTLLGLVLVYPAIRVYIPLNFSSQPPAGSIKVLSFNVAGYGEELDDGAKPADLILAYLQQQDADIVCLQEDHNCSDALFKLFPYNDTAHVSKPSNPLINAMGIHTRYPIIKKERIPYTSDANGSVAFFLQVGSDTVIVVNNHLESTHLKLDERERYQEMINGGMTSEDAKAETRFLLGKLGTYMAIRAQQADAIHRFVCEHSRYPVIVCGDFNDTPISYVRHTIAQNLTDCYVEAGSGLGISFNREGFYFRIDHLLCSPHFQPFSCQVDNSIKASDHYPIICHLNLIR